MALLASQLHLQTLLPHNAVHNTDWLVFQLQHGPLLDVHFDVRRDVALVRKAAEVHFTCFEASLLCHHFSDGASGGILSIQ
jgi:hypothetical protein